jgi:hypothetical protein
MVSEAASGPLSIFCCVDFRLQVRPAIPMLVRDISGNPYIVDKD